jgi:hypothetical protein
MMAENSTLTREDIKNLIIKSMYRSKLPKGADIEETEWFAGFIKECKTIFDNIPKWYPDEYEQQKIKKGNSYWNLSGSTASVVICSM